jgi:UDP-glucose 4-epimerase
MAKLLITGGAGYIGSHTVLECLNQGFDVVVVDNLSNSKQASLSRVETITGRKIEFYCADITDREALAAVFARHCFDAVVHFAGLKAVGESCQMPLHYYRNNVFGTQVLLEVMQDYAVKRLVFSSSATVYGDPHAVPIREDFPLQATNPYGRSKLIIEDIMRDCSVADGIKAAESPWQFAILRYFNPIGAHHSGCIGEDPSGIPNNLVPYITQVAIGKLPVLSIFGNDYPTHDGTGVRDYIKALQLLLAQAPHKRFCEAFNLGTGTGYSVLDLVAAFESVSGQSLPYRIVERRPGDVAACYADPRLASERLDWRAKRDLRAMMQDTWRWQCANPDGFAG